MIVVCTSCNARFRIADEKVGPRGIRIRCTKCRNVFAVQRPENGEEPRRPAVPPPPSRPFEVDLDDSGRARSEAPETPSPPPDPFASADPFAAPVGDPFAASAMPFDRVASPLQADPFAQPLGATVASSAGADPFAEAGLSLARGVSPPVDDPFSIPGSPPDGEAQPPAPLPHFFLPESRAEGAPPAPSAIPPPLPKRGAADATPSSRMSDPFALGVGSPHRELADPFGRESAGAEYPGVEAGGAEEQRRVATALSSKQRPAAAELTPASSAAVEKRRASARVERDGWLRALLVNSMPVAVLVVLALGLFMFWRGEGRELRMLQASRLIGKARGGAVAATQLSSGLYQAFDGRLLLFVRGRIRVEAPPARGAVRVRADIMKGEAVVATAESTAGAVPSPEELAGVAGPEGAERLRELLARRAPKRVRAGELLPFLVVFTEYPGDLEGVTIRVAAKATGAAGPG